MAELDKYFSNVELSPELSSSDVQSIQEWLSKQPHLPPISDKQVSIFLHSCYGAIELTKKTIDSYYTIRTHAPEIFSNRTPEEGAKVEEVVFCVFLPRPAPDGSHLMMLGFHNADSSLFNLLEAMRLATSVLELFVNERPYMNGMRFVFDMSGFTFGHLAKISTSLGAIRKGLCYVQDGLPVRLKGIHVFNALPMVHQVLMLIKPLMKKELYDMIRIHPGNDIESFYEFVPQCSLPEDYGGEQPSMNELIKKDVEKMKKCRQWFIDDDRLNKVDEQKRAGNPKSSNDIFDKLGSIFRTYIGRKRNNLPTSV